MNFLWELEDLEEEDRDSEIFPVDDDEEIIRNPRRHFSRPKKCCACERVLADLSFEELNQAIRFWIIRQARPPICRCLTSSTTRCAS